MKPHFDRTLRAMGWMVLLAGCLVAVGCEDCGDTGLTYIPAPVSQTDIYNQKDAAQVDILWVVDNSESMESEQNKIADRFAQFFKQLINSRVNFQIGVVTTDPTELGVLRSYPGDAPAVAGCDRCRYITKEVPCPEPSIGFAVGTAESAIEAGLADPVNGCPAQLVFRRLIKVGIDGANFEQGLTNAATALGAQVDPDTGGPLLDPNGNRVIPPENIGFLRNDASLYLIFVSDEEDGSRGSVRYFYRLFEGLKYAGNENRIAVSAITGWPVEVQSVTQQSICKVLESGHDSDASNDDPNLQTALDILHGEYGGCADASDEGNSPNRFANVGGRFIDLACRTDGVLADICSNDYSSALDDLGANAAGLLRKFELSKVEDAHFGLDCTPFTEDDPMIACGDQEEAEYALPICVIATPLAGGGEVVVPRSEISGWRYEEGTKSIRFDGTFLPAPGTEVRISYKLRPSSITCP